MKELLEYIAKALVDSPAEVSVTVREGVIGRDGAPETLLELRVAQGDMGKVIGRGGRIAKEIRILMRAAAQRQGQRISVDIVD